MLLRRGLKPGGTSTRQPAWEQDGQDAFSKPASWSLGSGHGVLSALLWPAPLTSPQPFCVPQSCLPYYLFCVCCALQNHQSPLSKIKLQRIREGSRTPPSPLPLPLMSDGDKTQGGQQPVSSLASLHVLLSLLQKPDKSESVVNRGNWASSCV